MVNLVDDVKKRKFMDFPLSSIEESQMLFDAVCFYDEQAFDGLKRLNVFKFVGHENGFSVFKFNKGRHKYLVNKKHENNPTSS